MTRERGKMQNESDSKHKLDKDQDREEQGQSRVTRIHGGELVELILPEDVKPMYDTACKHLNVKLSDSDALDEVECMDCPMVVVYDYGVIRSRMKLDIKG